MQNPEQELEGYRTLVSMTVPDYVDAIQFWHKHWKKTANYDTDQEMMTLIPEWIKNMVQYLEFQGFLKEVYVRFEYERGIFKSITASEYMRPFMQHK